MKRRSLIAVIAAVMVMASAVMSFAGTGLTLVGSTPEDGQKDTSIENLGVKLHFSNEISSDAVVKADEKLVKLVDEDGKSVPVQVLFSKKDKKMVLVVADTDKMLEQEYTVKNNSEYKCVIDANFQDDKGNTLGQETVVTFKTYNQKLNNAVNMVMMFVMFGGITVLTLKQQKDKEEETKPEEKKAPVNVYREAKRTGKTIEQVKAELAKEEAKAAKKAAKKNKGEEEVHKHIENTAKYLNNVYHVHAPAPTNHADRSVEGLRKFRKAEKKAAKDAAESRKRKHN